MSSRRLSRRGRGGGARGRRRLCRARCRIATEGGQRSPHRCGAGDTSRGDKATPPTASDIIRIVATTQLSGLYACLTSQGRPGRAFASLPRPSRIAGRVPFGHINVRIIGNHLNSPSAHRRARPTC